MKQQPNVLSHSVISYRLTLTGDINRTALEAGNSPAAIHGPSALALWLSSWKKFNFDIFGVHQNMCKIPRLTHVSTGNNGLQNLKKPKKMKKNISNTKRLGRKSVCISIALAVLLCTPPLAQSADLPEVVDPNGWKLFSEGIRIAYPEFNPDDNDGLLLRHGEDDGEIRILENGTFIKEGEPKEEGIWSYKDLRLKLFLNDNGKLFREFKVTNNSQTIDLVVPGAPSDEMSFEQLIENIQDLEIYVTELEQDLDIAETKVVDATKIQQKAENDLLAAKAKADAAGQGQREAENKLLAEKQRREVDAIKIQKAENDLLAAVAATTVAEAGKQAAEINLRAAETKTQKAVAQADAAKGRIVIAEAKTQKAVAATTVAEAGKQEALKQADAEKKGHEDAKREHQEGMAKISGALGSLFKAMNKGKSAQAQDAAQIKGNADGMAAGGQFLNLKPQTRVNPSVPPVPQSTAGSTANGFWNDQKLRNAAYNERFIQEQQIARAAEKQRVAKQQAKARADERMRDAAWKKRQSDYAAQQTAQRATLRRQEAARDSAAAAARRAAAQRQTGVNRPGLTSYREPVTRSYTPPRNNYSRNNYSYRW